MRTHIREKFERARRLHGEGKLQEAESLYAAILQHDPGHIQAMHLRGLLAVQTGRPQEGVELIQAAIGLGLESAAAQDHLGTGLKNLGRAEEALASFDKAVELDPNRVDVFFNRGNVLIDLKRLDEALASFDRAIKIKSHYPEAYNNRGAVLEELIRHEAALASFDTAIEQRPDYASAYFNRGGSLASLNRLEDAVGSFDAAIAINPGYAEAYRKRGIALASLGRNDQALASFDAALHIVPDMALAWLGRANVKRSLKRYDEAFNAYTQAVSLTPGLAEAWMALGNMLTEHGQHREAFIAFDQTVNIELEFPYAAGCRLFAKQSLCNWKNLQNECDQILTSVRNGHPAATPFHLLSIPSSPADQLACAKRYVADCAPAAPAIFTTAYSHDRIRVAYLSSDFRDHPVGLQLAGLFAEHDRSKFEWFGLSWGPNDQSDVRRRIENSFEHFIDVEAKSDADVSRLVRELEIDIAVDLNGHTQGSRLNVFSAKPAPIQVSYLGYPGTMGAPYIDYVLADATLISKDNFEFYSEKVVWLNSCFIAHDPQRRVSEWRPARAECDLPESAFVFCSFNNSYKITPAVFDIWMSLLRQVDGSVLWLLETHPDVSSNLKREAVKRNVAPERLIFAPRMSHLPDHLARHRLADLFLDTQPYTAAMTAANALSAGTPVLTCTGETYASRMAASLLRGLQLPELVTTSLDGYRNLALRIAGDTNLLNTLKAKLALNRDSAAAFNCTMAARQIEKAFLAM